MAAKIREEQKKNGKAMRTTTGSQVIGLDTVLGDIRTRLQRMEEKIDSIAKVNDKQDNRLEHLEDVETRRENRRTSAFKWLLGLLSAVVTGLAIKLILR